MSQPPIKERERNVEVSDTKESEDDFEVFNQPLSLEVVGNTHIRSEKLNGSTSFAIYNMHYVNFRIQV